MREKDSTNYETSVDWLEQHHDAQNILLNESHNLQLMAKKVRYLFPDMAEELEYIASEIEEAKALENKSVSQRMNEQMSDNNKLMGTILTAALHMGDDNETK